VSLSPDFRPKEKAAAINLKSSGIVTICVPAPMLPTERPLLTVGLLMRAVGIEPTTHGLKTPGGCVWSEL